jgi:hypothetical protein
MSAGSLTMSGKAAGALFNQKTVENVLKAFTFPADLAEKYQVIMPWIEAFRSEPDCYCVSKLFIVSGIK